MNHFWRGFYKAAGLRKEVATVGVIQDDKFLMGKRRDNGRWTNPGGHLDPGEEPIEGAARELLEESGIEAPKKDFKHLETRKVTTPKGAHYTIHAYLLDLSGKDVSTTMKEDPDAEVERWQWVSIKDGLSEDILKNLHSPDNVLLQATGLQEHKKEAAFWLSY